MVTVKQHGNFYDVTINGITIYGCSHKTGTSAKGDYDFISFPQRKGTKDGAEKWFPVVSVSKEVHSQVHAAILEYEGVAVMPTRDVNADVDDDSGIPF